MGYAEWIATYDAPPAPGLSAGAGVPWRPLVFIHVSGTDTRARALTLDSLRAQHHGRWVALDEADTWLARGAESADETPATETDTLRAAIHAGDRLPPHALSSVIQTFALHAHAALVYTDEDQWPDGGARIQPRFAPDFDLDLLCATGALGGLVVSRDASRSMHASEVSSSVAHQPPTTSHVLRLVESSGPGVVVHVPRVLLHRGGPPPSPASSDWQAVEAYLARQAPGATLTADVGGGPARVRYPLPARVPTVTLVMPTRNQPASLRHAVDSIRHVTAYASFDLLIVDNGSDTPEALDYLGTLSRQPDVRVVRDDRPFNWSALNNAAAMQVTSDLLCFLNDDVEAYEPEWLEELVRLAVRPDVGVVGARLWYPDDTLQHGGLVLHPFSGASHLHPYLRRDARGYLGLTRSTRRVSAVTGACLVVRREVFDAAGGFDEALPSDFNDVDFCLRVGADGLKTLYTPCANLIHHEGRTRGNWDDPAHRRRFAAARRLFVDRWGTRLARDPWFNPNLSTSRADPPLAWPPRLEPWRP